MLVPGTPAWTLVASLSTLLLLMKAVFVRSRGFGSR
jgi:hypothetical protein